MKLPRALNQGGWSERPFLRTELAIPSGAPNAEHRASHSRPTECGVGRRRASTRRKQQSQSHSIATQRHAATSSTESARRRARASSPLYSRRKARPSGPPNAGNQASHSRPPNSASAGTDPAVAASSSRDLTCLGFTPRATPSSLGFVIPTLPTAGHPRQ